MRVSTRRRLTLAPGWSAPAPAGSGSRFSCLRAQDGEDDSSTAVTSEASRRRKTDEELAAEFWADIGYPTPASRVWERLSSRRVSAQTTCALEASGTSTSPASHSMGSPAAARHLVRAPATSKSLVRPWIGPLPPPRISPTRTLGDALPLASLARATAFMQPATSTSPSSGVSPAESARLMGLGPLPTSGTSHPNRSLRMVNLNRWLSHMWNRDKLRSNPSLPRSFLAAVCSGMACDASAPPGSGLPRPAAAAPNTADGSSSGGAPGFAPGVFPPVMPSSSSTGPMPIPQQPTAPGKQLQHMYQMPQQFFQQQPMYHASPGYMQQMAPVYQYQPAGPPLQQNQGPNAVQPMAFNAGLANSATGVQTGTIRPRKPKGGKGNRPKNRAGNAPIIAAPPTLPYHVVQGATASVPGTTVNAAPSMAPSQQQQDAAQVAPAPGANTVLTKLWCTKCQSAGHVASDCVTQQYCFICNKANHPMTTRRCPALKMPKPAAMLCGYGTESMAFFQMPDNVCRADLAPQSSPTAIVTISGGSISSSIVEAEVAKIAQYQQQWTWEAIPHGQNAFIMSFPSDEVLLRVSGFTVSIKSHNVTLEFKACHSEEIPNRFELLPVWVHVHGVPHALRHFLGL
ncbi:hypothetical protein ACQJBY_048767 [Aegilops geniculata]